MNQIELILLRIILPNDSSLSLMLHVMLNLLTPVHSLGANISSPDKPCLPRPLQTYLVEVCLARGVLYN